MTSGPKNPNKTTAAALDLKAIAGVDKYFAHTKSLVVAGTTYTPATLTAVLQAEIDGDKAADEARSQYKQQVVAARLARAKASALRNALRTYVLNSFGPGAVQALEDFGFALPKAKGPQTAKSKAQAVDKAGATRAAKKEALATMHVATAPTTPAQTAAATTPSK